jgi:HEAT repeat protein
VKLLVPVLQKDADASVRRAAARQLARYGADPLVLEPLATAVGDPDVSVSTAAHEALQALTGRRDVGRRADEWRKAAAK